MTEIVLSGNTYDEVELVGISWETSDPSSFTDGYYDAEVLTVDTSDGETHTVERSELTIEEELLLDTFWDTM